MKFDRFLQRWASIVCRYPVRITVFALAFALAGAFLATHIKIKSSFTNLLPDNSSSVIDLKEISARMGGMGTLMIQVEGKSRNDLPAMEKFADDLAKRMAAYPKDEVLFVDYKVDAPKGFFERNKYLYADKQELSDIYKELKDYIGDKKAKANPFYIDLGDNDDDEKKEALNVDEYREKYNEKLSRFDKYIDGYLTNEAGDMLIVVVKTPGENTGVDFALRFVDKVEKEIAQLNPKKYSKNMEVYLTGELKTLPEEYNALRNDILFVSNLCVLLVLLAVSIYYRSFKLTLVLSIGLVCGVTTTFGIVYLAIGYLTAATAFLAAVVSGNGINFGIYFLARFIEERANGKPMEDTIATTLKSTVVSVATAAFAAGASYASLMATQFKGFNQFGFIGGIGMLICLVFALTLNPALLVLMERYWPLSQKTINSFKNKKSLAHVAAWLVENHSRKLLVFGAVAILVSTVSLVMFLRDPFEYDFRNLRNQSSQKSGSGKRSGEAEAILGERSSPHIVLADNLEQVPLIKKALRKYYKDNPDERWQAIKFIKTIYDYLPGTVAEQKEKIDILNKIRALVLKNIDLLGDDKKRDEIMEFVPEKELSPVTVETVPEELVRPYVELDGTRGTLLLVDMNGSIWRKETMERFSRVIKRIRLEDGTVIRSSGKVVIFNDMLDFVANEAPWATLGAFIAVLIIIGISFRRLKHSLIVGGAMMTGVILMMGVAVAFEQKLNFLNFIAIPIQFGIGVDYTVNIYARFLQEGPGSMGSILRKTGGAVLITSTTTIIGYGSMWFSINGAINSMANLANIGEVTCLFTAMLLMPAFVAVFAHGLKKKA